MLNKLKSLPIRHLLLAAFLLTGLLPSVLVTGLAFHEAGSVLTTEIAHDLETRARASADDIDRVMFERVQNAASWSRLEIMQEFRVDDVDKRLSKFLGELKTSYQQVYDALYVTDAQLRIIASSEPRSLGRPLSVPPDWLHIQLGGTDIHLSRPYHQQLYISARITDSIDAGQPGKLVAVLNWQQVSRILDDAVSGRTSAVLLDSAEQPLAATAGWQAEQTMASITASALNQGFQGLTEVRWRVIFSQHSEEALAPVRRMGLIFLGLLLATLVLASVMAVPVARTLSRPLAALTAFAQQFIRSGASLQPPVGGPAEIDSMARAFGQMIADLERSRANLTRAAKLAVVGEMAAAMSHEVRTPLGILRSSAQLLQREPALTPEGRELCGFIISETERLNRLVTTLIDAAKPRPLEFTTTDLSQLARQTSAMLAAQAQKKSITLSCPGTSQVVCQCDAEQMTQVLLNLLLNAIQLLPEGGHIEVLLSETDHEVLISVADDGPGIPPEQRDLVFDPFFTQRPGGVGLGLAVVRQIVHAHLGSISASESRMHGALFTIHLPKLKVETT
ncbi:sensor histidine kinase [Methylobacillus flagellatus]|uniref:sensor histidine kinase n=1 Tax=Methylobacillus flagellatus TaxID=405 RepID=UPI0010F7992A|nr:HAMP domain-containing sensor histidine kinase [Methylobacillus flagellatus]